MKANLHIPHISHKCHALQTLALLGFFMVLSVLSACSPTFNWRIVQLDGFGVSALWPCKPNRATRPVQMADQTLPLQMLSCDVAGHTFAWGAIQVPPNVETQTLMQAWQHASLNSLKASPEAVTAWQPSVRSDLKASGWRAQGVRHDGQNVMAHAVVLQHRHELHQLVIYGDPKPALITTWLEGMEAK